MFLTWDEPPAVRLDGIVFPSGEAAGALETFTPHRAFVGAKFGIQNPWYVSGMTLLNQFQNAVFNERKFAALVISLLVQVEKTMLYAEMGYSTLFDFLVKEFKYSESAAYRRISAMRLLKENEKVAEQIQSGELSLSNAAKISSVLRAAEKQKIDLPKEKLFQAALGATSREAEKKIAEIVLPRGLELKTKRDDFRELIETVKAAHSHALPALGDDDLFKFLLEKEAARLKTRGDTGRGKTESVTRYIPAQVKRQVQDRDRSCTFIDPISGRRCGATFFVQQHHRQAFAHGGPANAQNLTLHCAAHNRLEAKRAGL